MTYNFDADGWLARELAALEQAYRAGRLNEGALERARERLMARYEQMLDRLDGTYRLPSG